MQACFPAAVAFVHRVRAAGEGPVSRRSWDRAARYRAHDTVSMAIPAPGSARVLCVLGASIAAGGVTISIPQPQRLLPTRCCHARGHRPAGKQPVDGDCTLRAWCVRMFRHVELEGRTCTCSASARAIWSDRGGGSPPATTPCARCGVWGLHPACASRAKVRGR